MMNKILFLILLLIPGLINAQAIVKSAEFSLASPFVEPDGRSDYVKLPGNEFVTLAKTKGSVRGKSEFLLEKYNQDLELIWQVNLEVESSEDFKELFYNNQEIVLLSVVHLEKESRTKLEAYAFDPESGKKLWKKELESYEVEKWEMHPHKGRVKESFIDVVCEHSDPEFVTPFTYKHHLHFSPDHSKFISYIYNYGEKKLTATVSVYDQSCSLLKRGKISIDDDFINHGFYINNKGSVFIVNSNNFGKVNLIRYNLVSKEFDLLELPGDLSSREAI